MVGKKAFIYLLMKQAKRYISNPEKGKALVTEAGHKAVKEKGAIAAFRDKLELLVQLFQAWQRGEYRDVTKKTMIAVAAGLLYFVIPTDFIPDFLLGPGFLDDAAIISYVAAQVNKDLEKFREWQALNKNREVSVAEEERQDE